MSNAETIQEKYQENMTTLQLSFSNFFNFVSDRERLLFYFLNSNFFRVCSVCSKIYSEADVSSNRQYHFNFNLHCSPILKIVLKQRKYQIQ